MLSELVVHNFAIIEHLQVSFQTGLNVLSGETGAGKSILVGAVNLLLGGRALQEMIRSGADEAAVEAIFSCPETDAWRQRLHGAGLEPGNELLVRRTINRNGRNRVFVNDRLMTLQQLQQLTKGLVSVSGQHEHQSLLDPDIHIDLLDAFGALQPLRREVQQLYGAWSKTREQLQRCRQAKREQADKIDWMRFQLQELEAAKLQADEDQSLEQERNLLRHAATLREVSQAGYRTLYAERGAILEQLVEVEKSLTALAQIDASQGPLQDHLEQARIHLEELAHALQAYGNQITFDPQRLAAVEDRLALLQRLGKKYGPTVAEMLQRMETLRRDLSAEDSELREAELSKALARHREAYLDKARALSKQRREAAIRLSREVQETLAGLDMKQARFTAHFASQSDCPDADGEAATFTAKGIDQVEFLLAANPGENLKPLVRVASGGELSRILLALKSLLSHSGDTETLVFDEVDTGIGGRTAELVGLQLKRLAAKHQVICITHLPQIACYGEHHYKVAKQTRNGSTTTDLFSLSADERIEELARMLGGISISEKTRAHAREFLQRAQQG